VKNKGERLGEQRANSRGPTNTLKGICLLSFYSDTEATMETAEAATTMKATKAAATATTMRLRLHGVEKRQNRHKGAGENAQMLPHRKTPDRNAQGEGIPGSMGLPLLGTAPAG
jgi:hypothetical protein